MRVYDIDISRAARGDEAGKVVFSDQLSLTKSRSASVEAIKPEEAFDKVPAVFRATTAVYQNLALAPLVTNRRRDGKTEPDTESLPAEALARLLARPNAWLSGNDIVEWIGLWYMLRGEALIWMRFPAGAVFDGVRYSKPPVALFIVPPERIIAELEDGLLLGWKLRLASGQKRFIPKQDIVHIAAPNPLDDVRGLGPGGPSFQAADVSYAAQLATGKFFERGMKPSGVISVSGELPEAQRAAIVQKTTSQLAGLANFEGILVIGADAAFTQLTQTKDLEFREIFRWTKDEVAMAFGVPPILLSDVENANRANSQAQLRAFAETVLAPLWEQIASKLTFGLAKHFTTAEDERQNGELLLGFDTSGHPFLQENRREFAETAVRISDAVIGLAQAGLARRAEARAIARRAGLSELAEEEDDREEPENPEPADPETIPDEGEPTTDAPRIENRAARARRALLQAKKAVLRRIRKGARTAEQAMSKQEIRRLGRVFGREAAETLVAAIRAELGEGAIDPEKVAAKFEELQLVTLR